MIVQSMPYPAVGLEDLDNMTISDAVWSWFSDPRGISVNGRPMLGSVSTAGDIQTHHATTVSPSPVDLATAWQIDDHDVPGFLRRNSDGRILAFYSQHNGANPRLQISTNPDDPSSWGSPTNIAAAWSLTAYSYAHPFQLLDEANDPIYFFFRAQAASGQRAIHMSKSTDDGATFPAPTRIIAGTYYYVKMAQFGNGRIGMAITQHPQDASDPRPGGPVGVSGYSSLYYVYYEGGTWQEIGGSPITLPIDPTALTPVYNGPSNSADAWVHDLQFDGSGNPVIAFATYANSHNPRYRYARHNGSSWSVNEVAAGGDNAITPFNDLQPFYTGGFCIDPADVNIVYFGQLYLETWRMMRGVTADGGANWTFTVKGDSAGVITEKLMRPFVVPGQTAQPRLAFLKGPYRDGEIYDTDIELMDSNAGDAPETPGDFAVRRVALRRETGTQDIIIPGFGTPTGVWFEIAPCNMLEFNETGDLSGSYGAYDGTSQACVYWDSKTSGIRRGNTTEVARASWGSEIVAVSATALIDGGVRISVTQTVDQPYALTVMMTKAPNVKVGTVQFQTQNNTRTVTPGFRTDALLMASHQDVFDNANKTLAIVTRGYASASSGTVTGQASVFYRRDAATSPIDCYGEIRESVLTFPGTNRYVEFGNVTSTAFGLTSRGGDLTTAYGLYMAIGGVSAFADVFDLPTAGGDANFTGASFTPELFMAAPTMITTVGTRIDGGPGSGWGSFVTTDQASAGLNWWDRDGSTALYNSRSQRYLRVVDHNGVERFVATFNAWRSDGATLTFSSADSTTRKMAGLFLAP